MIKLIIILTIILFAVFLIYRKIKRTLNIIFKRLFKFNDYSLRNFDNSSNEIIYKKDDIEVLKGEAKKGK